MTEVKKVHIPVGVKWAQLTPEQRAYKKSLDAAAKDADNNKANVTTSKRKVGNAEFSDDDDSSSSSSSSSSIHDKIDKEPPLKKKAVSISKTGKSSVKSLKPGATDLTIDYNNAVGSPLFNGKTWSQLTPAEKEEKKKLDAARNHSIAIEMVTQDLQKEKEKKQQSQRNKGGGNSSDSDSDSVSVSSDSVDDHSRGLTNS